MGILSGAFANMGVRIQCITQSHSAMHAFMFVMAPRQQQRASELYVFVDRFISAGELFHGPMHRSTITSTRCVHLVKGKGCFGAG